VSGPSEVVGVLGGSFDPPHVGHVLVASWALSVTEVSRVVVVPALRHAFGKSLQAYEHRVRMCELAFADLGRVSVSRIEAELGGAGYTVDMLEALAVRLRGAKLRLVMGADLEKELPKWRRPERVVALAPPLVVGRCGHGERGEKDVTLPEVSSTDVRRRLAAGESVASVVPRSVLAHIEAHGLYRGAT
jgi:nicotinate-nucleotide adenylyltransferase